MAQIVKKAIIPAAGLGTRFLPATKAMAKEMLPIVDKPTIQFIVEEAQASGITDILIITGKSKRPIEDHFDANFELEENLIAKGQTGLLELVKETTDVNLYFMRQSKPKGLGHAVSLGKAFVGNEPFVVMLGDDLMVDDLPLTKQLINNYEATTTPTVAVMEIPDEETSKYGIISPAEKLGDGIYEVDYFVEKPSPDKAPSNLAIIGRYLLTPAIFDILDHQAPGAGGEIQLTDAINTLNKTEQVAAYLFKGERYDVGDKFGFMKTNIAYGLKHPEVKKQLREFIIDLGKELTQEK